MSNEPSVDQYGRKTWNIDEYAKRAKVPKKEVRTAPAVADKSSSQVDHRQKLLEQAVNAVGKHTLVNPLNTKTYGKEKRFGFFCPVCDLSYRDTMALVDHLNSPQHIARVVKSSVVDGEEEREVLDGGVRRASPAEVERMLQTLIARKKSGAEAQESMEERVEKRKEREEELKEKKRAKRQRKKGSGEDEDADGDGMAEVMGFSKFG